MKATCPSCGKLVPVTYGPGAHPKPSVLARHGERRACRGSGAVDANWKPPRRRHESAPVEQPVAPVVGDERGVE